MTGTLALAGVSYSFTVNGNLIKVTAENQDEVYVGSLTGYVNDEMTPDSMLALTLHYNQTTGESFVPVCVGSYGAGGQPPVEVEFGHVFPGLSSAVKAYVERRDSVRQAETAEIADGDSLALNATDTDETSNMKSFIKQAGAYQNYQVIFGSTYAIDYVATGGNWTVRNRAQIHLNNFKKGHAKTFSPVGTTESGVISASDYTVDTVWLNFTANNQRCLISGAFPDEFKNSIPVITVIKTPYGLLNQIASLLDLHIPVQEVSHIRSNNGSKLQTKIANSVGGLTKAVTTLTKPYSEETGVANAFQVYNPVGPGGTVLSKANVSAEIAFIAMRENGVSYLDSVIVSTPEKQFTLHSLS